MHGGSISLTGNTNIDEVSIDEDLNLTITNDPLILLIATKFLHPVGHQLLKNLKNNQLQRSAKEPTMVMSQVDLDTQHTAKQGLHHCFITIGATQQPPLQITTLGTTGAGIYDQLQGDKGRRSAPTGIDEGFHNGCITLHSALQLPVHQHQKN